MPLIEPIIRPPSEAASILLQVTTGCSANTCTFCGAYKTKKYRIVDRETVFYDIDEYARIYPDVKKLFLLDGDALCVPQPELVYILDRINNRLPDVNRISSYTNDSGILARTQTELEALRYRKLRLVYMGLETGSQSILDGCGKKSTVAGMIEAVQRAKQAGILCDIIVLLGIGGRARTREHVALTAEALNSMQPDFLAFLSLMLIPGTPLALSRDRGELALLDARELLVELHEIITLLDLKKTYLRATHASNYLPIEGRLPNGKDRMLRFIDLALRGEIDLVPETYRRL